MLLHYTSRRALKEEQASLEGFFFVLGFLLCFCLFLMGVWPLGIFNSFGWFLLWLFFFHASKQNLARKLQLNETKCEKIAIKIILYKNIYTFLISEVKRNTLFGVAPFGPSFLLYHILLILLSFSLLREMFLFFPRSMYLKNKIKNKNTTTHCLYNTKQTFIWSF